MRNYLHCVRTRSMIEHKVMKGKWLTILTSRKFMSKDNYAKHQLSGNAISGYSLNPYMRAIRADVTPEAVTEADL